MKNLNLTAAFADVGNTFANNRSIYFMLVLPNVTHCLSLSRRFNSCHRAMP